VDYQKLQETVADSLGLKRRFFETEGERVLEAGRLLAGVLRGGRKIFAFGNGGSAADAQHFSSELVNRYVLARPALPAIALTTDTSTLTSVANDTGYRFVFSRQLEALGSTGDAALAISTSGHSENVLEAVEVCRKKGIPAIGLTGRDGGALSARVELCLNVEHQETARVQEVHAMIVHLLCQIIEEELYPEDH
jgi:D-sedoheptulose 7-phosphate isomerase